MTHVERMQIGEVAEQTGLSLRTIRHYEEVGLVPPSGRSTGGFRLYIAADVERLQVVKRMKPLGFSLEEMRDLLEILDRLAAPDVRGDERKDLDDRLRAHLELATQRVETLRSRLRGGEEFVRSLAERLTGATGARRPLG